MTEFAYQIRIPQERIAILIGKKGEVKRKLSELTKTKIEVDSKEGEVNVSGEDALLLYSTREIIKAIARGFNPDIAMILLKQDYSFEVISLPEFNKESQFRRIKGRIIGTDGKTRRIIEENTDAYISVYGKTIAIISRNDTIHLARKAIEMIIKGSPHSSVYQFLERMRRQVNQRQYGEKFEDFLRDNDKEKEEE